MRRATLLGLAGLFAAVLLPAAAQSAVTVTARIAPARVGVGEPADLSVIVQGAQDVAPPAVPAVDGLAIQYVGPETQLSIVNGQMNAQVIHHYSVVPQREGRFSIGPLVVEYQGGKLGAGSVAFEATSGRAAGQPPGGAAAGGAGEGEPLRLSLVLPRTTVYVNERLPLTVSLAVGTVRVGDVQYPTIPGGGFALEPFAEPTQRQETIDGGAFQVVDFRSALVPLKAGPLRLGPATLSLSQVTQQARRGFFFGGAVRRPLELQSAPVDLLVLPLPDAARPSGFGGAVGKFALGVSAAPLTPSAGDPVTLTITLRGEGNLAGAVPPGLSGTDQLRVYPVQAATQQQAAQASGAALERSFEQVVIPQRPGTVVLPPLTFAYFDPEARTYRTAAAPPVTLTVAASPQAATAPQIVGGSAPARQDETPLGRDIVFIKDTPGTLAPLDAGIWRSPAFWLLQLVPPALWVVVVWWSSRRRRLGSDPRWARFSRAGGIARGELAAARAALDAGDRAAFYDRLAAALQEYLSAKLDLPPGGITAERTRARLAGSRLPPAVLDDLSQLLATCEQVRFAPGAAADGDLRGTLARASGVVRALERTRGLRAVGILLLALALAGGAFAASAAPETPSAAFFRANAAYADGRFADAAAGYQSILDQGLGSPNVYFNLGNAWLRAGDPGRAILEYERARRLAPRDPDVRANLRYARTQAAPADEPSLVARLLFPFASLASTDGLLLAAAGAWWLLWVLLALQRLLPAVQRAAFWGLLAVGVALVVVVPSAAWRLLTIELTPSAVVVAKNEVSVRYEPADTGTVHFAVRPGAVLRLLGDRGEWTQVARGDGARGWLQRSALAPL